MKRILFMTVVGTLLFSSLAFAQGATRDTFNSRRPDVREVLRGEAIHGESGLSSSDPKDHLGLEETVGVVRFRSSTKGLFDVTVPIAKEGLPSILAITCKGKSGVVDGVGTGDEDRRWELEGCKGKTPSFKFLFEGDVALAVKLGHAPADAKTVGVLALLQKRDKGLSFFKKTMYGDPVKLTDSEKKI